MIFREIIDNCKVVSVTGNELSQITAVTPDSRKVTEGSLFLAVKGYQSDGHNYIAQAVAAGAKAVVYEASAELSQEAKSALEKVEAAVCVEDSRWALAQVADNFYGHPSRKLKLVGITGTNGKTTTVTLLYNLFMGLGYNCGLLSTIANYVGREESETTNTTSDPLTINRLMAKMVEQGCEYCFMEVSSIGMEQQRVAALDFDCGIFSNLTHDHLDYHKTFAEYLRCKKLFFDSLGAKATAIINTDDKNGRVMVQNTAARVVTYALSTMADHTCRIMEQGLDGMLLKIDGQEVWTPIIGRHNAYNLLAIYTTAIELGTDKEEALIGISKLSSAKGRLETLKGPRDISVIIDYAHTPDALDNILNTLKEAAPCAYITTVFGCGGDRDRTKRPQMAAIAEKYSDRIIVTSDNSRTEKTEDIIEEIKTGFSTKGLAKTLSIPDRKEAIRTAILTAPQGSGILLAGKGHETYQILGKETHHFDEREIVKEVFEAL